jgi:hypothetical protein
VVLSLRWAGALQQQVHALQQERLSLLEGASRAAGAARDQVCFCLLLASGTLCLRRPRCVQAVSASSGSHNLTPFVLCCRCSGSSSTQHAALIAAHSASHAVAAAGLAATSAAAAPGSSLHLVPAVVHADARAAGGFDHLMDPDHDHEHEPSFHDDHHDDHAHPHHGHNGSAHGHGHAAAPAAAGGADAGAGESPS